MSTVPLMKIFYSLIIKLDAHSLSEHPKKSFYFILS